MSKLKSRKREMFAIEVASMTPLATAYVLAGYADTPWARYNASKLAHVSEVAARIDELQTQFSERSGIHAEYIQRKLLPLIEANPKDLYETQDDGKGQKVDKLRSISEIPRDLAAAIQKIKCDPETGTIAEIFLYNKTEAGNVLLRSVGGILDRLEATGKDGGPVQIERIERVIVYPPNSEASDPDPGHLLSAANRGG